MDYMVWNQILYELTFAVSGGQDLDGLVKKATQAFIKKLNCTHVSVLQYKDQGLQPIYAIPHIILKDPAYYDLIEELGNQLVEEEQEEYIHIKGDQYYYGFPLRGFGLLLIGNSQHFGEVLLKELIPVTNMFAQNCFFAFDVAKSREEKEAELRQERLLLRTILDTIPDLIFYQDNKGYCRVANKAAMEFLNLSSKEIIGQPMDDIQLADEKCSSLSATVPEGIQRYETNIKARDNTQPFEVIKAPVNNIEGQQVGAVAVCRDIKDRKHYEDQLKYFSTHDQLTGLYNRRFFNREIKGMDVWNQLPISIIMADLNGLKLINDMFGHSVGDDLIVKAVEIIKQSCREEDLIIRWGGDEFVIFLPQTNERTAEAIANRIKEKVGSQKCGYIQMSIATGWVTKTKASGDIWQMFNEANDNMYADKLVSNKNYERTVIRSLRLALAEKSRETEEHIHRLNTILKIIGERMDLNQRQLYRLEQLAVYHDIGKICIEEELLNKAQPLSKEERRIVREHPETGHRIIKAIPRLAPIAESILYHHEHWDGEGYPKGLKEGEIPFLSRILAVAHTFEELTTGGISRDGMTEEEALNTIKERAGTQFDPKVVDALIETYGNKFQ